MNLEVFMSNGRNIYLNGNYIVRWKGLNLEKRCLRLGEDFISEFPDSIDLKITNKCPWNCPYCHESSTIDGESFDLEKTKSILSQLPQLPIEIAIGGGDVLDAPGITDLIDWLNSRGNRTRVTVNVQDILKRRKEVKKLKDVGAIGISIDNLNFKLQNDTLEYPSLRSTFWPSATIFGYDSPTATCVIHIIAGIFPVDQLDTLFEVSEYPILVLGYKQWGRAKDSNLPEHSIQKFREKLISIINKVRLEDYTSYIRSKTIGFDNLAIEQLRIKEFLPEDEWENLYMGDEGQHSMYIDAVRGEFARTSRSEERTSWDDVGLIDFFNSLKNDSTNK